MQSFVMKAFGRFTHGGRPGLVTGSPLSMRAATERLRSRSCLRRSFFRDYFRTIVEET